MAGHVVQSCPKDPTLAGNQRQASSVQSEGSGGAPRRKGRRQGPEGVRHSWHCGPRRRPPEGRVPGERGAKCLGTEASGPQPRVFSGDDFNEPPQPWTKEVRARTLQEPEAGAGGGRKEAGAALSPRPNTLLYGSFLSLPAMARQVRNTPQSCLSRLQMAPQLGTKYLSSTHTGKAGLKEMGRRSTKAGPASPHPAVTKELRHLGQTCFWEARATTALTVERVKDSNLGVVSTFMSSVSGGGNRKGNLAPISELLQ